MGTTILRHSLNSPFVTNFSILIANDFFNICYVPVTVLVLCVYYVAVVWLLSLTQLCEGMDCSLPGSSACGDSPGKNTGVGSHALLERIFPTQGLNLCLLHWEVDTLPLSHLGCPKIVVVGD